MVACLSTHFAPSKLASAWDRAASAVSGSLGRRDAAADASCFSGRSDQLFPGKRGGNQRPAGGRDHLRKTSRGGSDHRESAGQCLDDDRWAGVEIFRMEQDVMAAVKFRRSHPGRTRAIPYGLARFSLAISRRVSEEPPRQPSRPAMVSEQSMPASFRARTQRMAERTRSAYPWVPKVSSLSGLSRKRDRVPGGTCADPRD